MSTEFSTTDKRPTVGPTSEEILLILGVVAYCPEYRHKAPFGSEFAFDRIMTLAVSRGFPRRQRRLLKGNVRGAQVKGVALERASAVLAFVTEEELRHELLEIDWWYRVLGLTFTRMRTGSGI